MAELSTVCGFAKGVSVDVSYLYVLEYNPPYVQLGFTCNLGKEYMKGAVNSG